MCAEELLKDVQHSEANKKWLIGGVSGIASGQSRLRYTTLLILLHMIAEYKQAEIGTIQNAFVGNIIGPGHWPQVLSVPCANDRRCGVLVGFREFVELAPLDEKPRSRVDSKHDKAMSACVMFCNWY